MSKKHDKVTHNENIHKGFTMSSTADNKKKALDAALSQIERQFGKGAIMKMGEGAKLDIDTVSTGSLGLDIALGAGGLPYGRICEIY